LSMIIGAAIVAGFTGYVLSQCFQLATKAPGTGDTSTDTAVCVLLRSRC